MENTLGNWAVIDLETSGVNPNDDSIIDVGFLQFEGTKLVRKYNSLVRFPMSPFIMITTANLFKSQLELRQDVEIRPIMGGGLPEVQTLWIITYSLTIVTLKKAFSLIGSNSLNA